MRKRAFRPVFMPGPALALLLAGCSLTPPVPTIALPTAPRYPDAGQPIDGVRAVDLGWRTLFTDPHLQGLIAQALTANRDLRIAVLRIDEARAQYRLQRADLLPQIETAASVTRGRGFAGVGGIPAGTDSATRFALSGGVSAFELDFWGRVRALGDAAREIYFATIAAQRAFQISLVATVADTYLTGRELDERIALAQRTVRSRSEALDIARLRLDAGVTSALDYRQSETLLTQAQAELAALERERARTANLLDQLVGGPPDPALTPPLSLSEQQLDQAIVPGLPSELLVNRPDIVQAEAQLRAAGANIGAARAAFLPRLSLTGLLGFASPELGSLFSDGAFTWSAGPAAALPLFDAGRRDAVLDIAVARRNVAVADYERTIQTAFREVADALAARRTLGDQLAAQRRAVVAQRDRAELAELRYRNGVAAYIEVLDAQRELFAAEQALIQIRRLQLSSTVALYAALGGGLR